MKISSLWHAVCFRALCAAILSVFVQAASASQGTSSGPEFTLESDRTMRVRILSDLNSRNARAGQSFSVAAVDDVYAGDMLVVPKNSLGRGSIVAVRKAKSFWRRGRLQIAITSIFAPDGTVIPVVLPNGTGGVAPVLRGKDGPFGFFADDVVVPCGAIATVLVAEDTLLRGYRRDELAPRPRPPPCGH